ncbi:MAG: T9SS type A sorting domain-containing protein [Bacteroidia bacterium]|nr:T9SS type A sorting domain-containing protein [Bacteroidia bacterium]
MNIRFLLILLFTLHALTITAQSWKTYPYTPPGSLVSFPSDEGRHVGEPIEWWYTSGHLTGETTGKRYSYMYTFFHYPQAPYDGFRIMNITDEDTGAFYQNVLPLNYTTLSTTSLDIEANVFGITTESWKNKIDGSNNPIPFEYELNAAGPVLGLTLDLVSTKHPLILSDDGYLEQGLTNYTYYYSLTSNTISGSITAAGISENVTGTGWIDRQYGSFNPLTGEKYEWFSMQLSNGMDLNLWNIFTTGRTIPDDPKYRILSAYVDESTQYTTDDFTIERLEFFCTPDDANCYSKKWRLVSPVNDIDLEISLNHTTSEVQLPFRFMESATSVTGTINGLSVSGIGFAELLHTYEDPDISITSPLGTYDPESAISWTLNNPDEGRPILYDIEYSTDNQLTYNPVVQNLESTNFVWNNPAVINGDEVFFKIIAHTVDNSLSSETVSLPSETLSDGSRGGITVKSYPNPVENGFNVRFNRPVMNFNLDMIDIQGRVLKQVRLLTTSGLEIDLSDQAPGIYFLKLSGDGLNDIVRLIKK